ncbi:preprotein translocase subunit SecE [Micromonospora sp. WMMD1102]|uniref:preprotein translocase subunit SecE n=1 Tax=Micromonospora sp. WMMD1102 TaxID=3016105 RepID=UPI0024158C19|nr:preprotein translocase subunit SecE [Micromonospora sp. WMMD1102]MDG4789985.1 preprotein translocase subunit SecE [Micromonospora sp. WMMD1102]
MADKNRRDEDDNDRLDDEMIDDAVDDDADEADEPVGRGGTATRERTRADSADSRPKTKTEGRVGMFGRLARFFREVVAELRKVIWPTRKELLTYTAVVVVFVAVVLTIVAGLDYAFARGVLWVFGGSS